jgi:hypothetical protein
MSVEAAEEKWGEHESKVAKALGAGLQTHMSHMLEVAFSARRDSNATLTIV